MSDTPANRLKRAATALVHGFLVLALCVLALSVFTQVVMRYALSSPPFWTEELARFVLIWLTFVGVAAVQISREQIRVDWVQGMLPETGRRILHAVNSLIVLAVLAVIVWAGYAIAELGSQTSPAMGISMHFIYGALPVGAAITLIVALLQFAGDVASIFAGEAEHDN